jgi:hypothetical protein
MGIPLSWTVEDAFKNPNPKDNYPVGGLASFGTQTIYLKNSYVSPSNVGHEIFHLLPGLIKGWGLTDVEIKLSLHIPLYDSDGNSTPSSKISEAFGKACL